MVSVIILLLCVLAPSYGAKIRTKRSMKMLIDECEVNKRSSTFPDMFDATGHLINELDENSRDETLCRMNEIKLTCKKDLLGQSVYNAVCKLTNGDPTVLPPDCFLCGADEQEREKNKALLTKWKHCLAVGNMTRVSRFGATLFRSHPQFDEEKQHQIRCEEEKALLHCFELHYEVNDHLGMCSYLELMEFGRENCDSCPLSDSSIGYDRQGPNAAQKLTSTGGAVMSLVIAAWLIMQA